MFDDLEDMAIFAQVVKAKSFTAAAEQAGLSASAVSKHVSRLEARLKARLLNRTTRQLSLTEAGAVFYTHCERMLAEARAAEDAVLRLYAEPRGTVTLVTPVAFGVTQVAPVLPALLERYPELRVDLRLDDQLIDPITEAADVIIRLGPLADSSLQARPLANSSVVVCAAPAYLKPRRWPTTIADLAAHDCLQTRTAPPSVWEFNPPANPSSGCIAKVSGRLIVNSLLGQRAAALAGAGIARLPAYLVSADMRAGALQQLLSDVPQDIVPIHAVYPQNRRPLPKVRALIDFLAVAFKRAEWNCGQR